MGVEYKEVSINQAIHYRNYRRARDRALVRLSKLYPNLYKELLAEEKATDEREGKNWVANSGHVTVTVGSSTKPVRKNRKGNRKPSRTRAKARNKGGKA
jgi:hypothetical protein